MNQHLNLTTMLSTASIGNDFKMAYKRTFGTKPFLGKRLPIKRQRKDYPKHQFSNALENL